MLVLTRCSSFPSRGWVGGAQGEEPKDNPTPTERRDRSLEAQGPIPAAPTLTGWDRTATPRCYCPASPGRGAKGPTQPGETRTLPTLANTDCFLGGPSRVVETPQRELARTWRRKWPTHQASTEPSLKCSPCALSLLSLPTAPPSRPLPDPAACPADAHVCPDLGTHLSALNSPLVCHRWQCSLKQ